MRNIKKKKKDPICLWCLSTFISDGSSRSQVIHIWLISRFFLISESGIVFLVLFDGIKFDYSICLGLGPNGNFHNFYWNISFITLLFNGHWGLFPQRLSSQCVKLTTWCPSSAKVKNGYISARAGTILPLSLPFYFMSCWQNLTSLF